MYCGWKGDGGVVTDYSALKSQFAAFRRSFVGRESGMWWGGVCGGIEAGWVAKHEVVCMCAEGVSEGTLEH